MPIIDRSALEASPLADLHAIASELSIDGYRRMRRAELIDAILSRQGAPEQLPGGGEPAAATPGGEAAGGDELVAAVGEELRTREEGTPVLRPRRRGRRGPRGRGAGGEGAAIVEVASGRGGDSSQSRQRPPRAEEEGDADSVEGVVELLDNGSGFARLHPPEPSDDDVYISAAQVKRCELVSGDRVSGPRRAPRRSERFASLVRIDTINGRPAAEVAATMRFDELPAAFPSERFRLGSDDPTIKAIEFLTPIGRGSRVTLVGPARAGKTHALRSLAGALSEHDGTQVVVVLAGVRPEELSEWAQGPVKPSAALSFAASAEAQAQGVESALDEARRLAARGSHVSVVIDTLDGLHAHAARKALACARNILDGGSLTVIATASRPLGGETTVIVFDAILTSTGRFPAIDLVASWTIRPELLVGDAGAEEIAQARREAIGD